MSCLYGSGQYQTVFDMPVLVGFLRWSDSWGGVRRIALHVDTSDCLRLEQWWCRQSRREKNERGRAVQQRLHKQRRSPSPGAHGRGSRPPPALHALPASLTPATIPLVSQQAMDFMLLCFLH